MLNKKQIGQIVYPALLGLFTLLFFCDTLFFGKVFVFRDFSRYFYPYKKFATEWLQSGVLPLWNPLSSCGTPFFAGLQSQVAYPLSLLHYILPFNFGFHLFIAVHYFLAAYFLYLLCLDLKVSKTSALLGGLLFAFSGYTVSLVDLTTTLSSVVWLPLVLLLYRRALFESGSFRKVLFAVSTSFALLFQFLGGEPTVLYGTFGILLLFTAVYYEKISGWILLPSIFALTVLLSAFQLLPFLEFLNNSDRGIQSTGLTQTLNSLWSLPPAQLLAVVVPYFTGDITKLNVSWYDNSQLWLKSVYTGLLPVVLFITGMFIIRKEQEENKRLILFLYLTAFISLLFALGNNTVLYSCLYNFVPGYSRIRFPVKFFFGAVFAVSVLTALVFERLTSLSMGIKARIRYFGYALFLFLLITAASVSLVLFHEKLFALALRGYLLGNIIERVNGYDILLSCFEKTAAIFAAACLTYMLFLKNKITKGILFAAVLALVAGDLFINNYFINPSLDAKFYTELTPLEKDLQNKQTDSRVLLDPALAGNIYLYGESFEAAMQRARLTLYPNQNMLHDIYMANGYDSLNVGNYYNKFNEFLSTGKARYISLLSVDRIITAGGTLEKSIFKKEYDYGAVKVFKNNAYLPRCYFVENFTSFIADTEADKYIAGDNFDPLKEAVITGFGVSGVIRNRANRPLRGLEIVKSNPNTFEVLAEVHGTGIVVLTDTFYPGWKAFLDGEETKVGRVNGFFKGILCGKGIHNIKFVFSPDSLWYGAVLSITGFLGVFLALIILYNVTHGRESKKTDRRRKKSARK